MTSNHVTLHRLCLLHQTYRLSTNRSCLQPTNRMLPCFISRRITREYSSRGRVGGRVISYYDMLEMTPKASQKQIKAAYYRLSKKYHPDVNKEPDAKEKFAMIAQAYEVLGNQRTRSLYDSGSLSPTDLARSGSAPMSGDDGMDDDYRSFLRNRQRGTGFRSRPGEPLSGRTKIYDFDEFYRQHYGETLKKIQEDRKMKEWLKQEGTDESERTKYQTLWCSLVMACVTIALWIKHGQK